MIFEKFIERYADLEVSEDKIDEEVMGLNIDVLVKTIYVYEKDFDSEPVFVLYNVNEHLLQENAKKRKMEGDELYIVGNVYSTLAHRTVIGEKELRKMIKSGKYIEK